MTAPIMAPDRGVARDRPQVGVVQSSRDDDRRLLASPQSQPRPPPPAAPSISHNAAISPSYTNITPKCPPGYDLYLTVMRRRADML